jgi:integrative and conjugative element protein (TIGR02256 family)
MEYISGDRRRLVVLPASTLNALEVACRGKRNETGGMLVGHSRADGAFVITEVLPAPPDSKATRTTFQRGRVGVDNQLARCWVRGDRYIGEWHLHPSAAPRPSSTDKRTLKAIADDANYDCPAPLLLVVGGGGRLALHEFIDGAFLELSEVRVDPTDPLFLSYRRARVAEVTQLRQSLNEHGIQTWQDLQDLGVDPLAPALRKAITEETSGILYWVSPEVEQSGVIRHLEAKEGLELVQKGTGYHAHLTLHGGLQFTDLPRVLGSPIQPEALKSHPTTRFTDEPVADRVRACTHKMLKERLKRLPKGELRIGVRTYDADKKRCGESLCFNWTAIGQNGYASSETWARLTEAARTTQSAIASVRTRDKLIFTAQAALPAAILLGNTFHQSTGEPAILQGPQFATDPWAKPAGKELAKADIVYGDFNSKRGCVVVEWDRDVMSFVNRQELGPYAWYVHVRVEGRMAESARDLADVVKAVEDLRRKAAKKVNVDELDLYVAGPVGLAFTLGQATNAWPRFRVMQFHKNADSQQYSVGPILNGGR